jgi:hypothetical protein
VSGWALTTYGVLALTFMMAMYGLERRGPRFVLAFAAGCLLASSYGFLSGAWPFGVVEAIWALVAARRYWQQRASGGSWPSGARGRPAGNGVSPRASTGGGGSGGPPGRQTGSSPHVQKSDGNRIEGQERK